MRDFLEALEVQRWDDHRYYHHNRINQSLHLLSAISFLYAYFLLFVDPAQAAMVGWLMAMVSRQLGHFFFEPKGYDEVNQATHEHKEEIKVGYNLRRKVVLLSIWAMIPAILYFKPAFYGMVDPAEGFFHNLALLWLGLGVAGLLFRTFHLFYLKDVRTGLVWLTKILTDPFHDVKLYHKAPFYVLRGELLDPMEAVKQKA